MTIFSWVDIEKDFTDGIILGNGASIAFDSLFKYPSLLERAQENRLITEDVRKVFDHLNTTDFELVLRMLWHSSQINNALDITDKRTRQAYISVRNALIEIVREIHISHEEVEDKLGTASEFLRQFSTVVSLSYDILVYWSILMGNDNSTVHIFKDCFIHGRFTDDWREFRDPIGSYQSTTLVVYPHGNLALAADIVGSEYKISSTVYKSLLETVFNRWTSDEVAPIFVSEGTKEQKLASISRSLYLSTVYQQILTDIKDSIVIFGWSISENDIHILDAICKGQPSRIAWAVNPTAANLPIQTARLRLLLSERLKNPSFELILFDRNSPGCWINL